MRTPSHRIGDRLEWAARCGAAVGAMSDALQCLTVRPTGSEALLDKIGSETVYPV